MKQFKDLGVTPAEKTFVGDKIKIDRVLNKEIIVDHFKIVDSKFTDKGNRKCLHIQINHNDELRVLFTGSSFLIDTIQKVNPEDFPFKTTIIKQNDHYEFS